MIASVVAFPVPHLSEAIEPVLWWIEKNPFETWPQQNRLSDGALRPAMVTDLGWNGFGNAVEDVIQLVMQNNVHRQRCAVSQRMLSVVMPGHAIEPHKDAVDQSWLMRIHVPILTNHDALFIVDEKPNYMAVGLAYRVNVTKRHEIKNEGTTPRVHLMWDLLQQ